MTIYKMTKLATFLLLLSMPLYGISSPQSQLTKATKYSREGNPKDAYQILKKLAHNPTTPSKIARDALKDGVRCLRRLNKVSSIDNFIEKGLKIHPKSWRVHEGVARIYIGLEHFGFIIGGEFERGSHRGGGNSVNSYQRDRVRALQLFTKAIALAKTTATANEKYSLYTIFSEALMYNRGYSEAWRLQYLTNLKALPDYEKGYGYSYFRGGSQKGAPVTAEGKPVFYPLIAKFADCQNDGEKWRWLLSEAGEVSPSNRESMAAKFANFLMVQFGVQTMGYSNSPFMQSGGGKDESGPYAVSSLKDSETIAKLATGIKRFTIPKQYNFIFLFHQIAESENKYEAEKALGVLARIYTNRRQYGKAAEIWRESIKKYGDSKYKNKEKALSQIIGNLGRFTQRDMSVPGVDATVGFRFRNAKSVNLEIYPVKVKKLLNDVKKYLKSNPAKLDWKKLNISNIGYRIVRDNESQYLGEKLSAWNENLTPLDNHFDKEITIKTPIIKSGAYLIVAKLPEGSDGKPGNISRIIVWVTDTVIVKKQLDNKILYYVADAKTGKGISNANLNIFGYRQKYVGKKLLNAYSRRYQILTDESNVTTGKNGLTILDKGINSGNNRNQCIVTATTSDGHFAYLGFQRIWFGKRYDSNYNSVKTFLITDRPVYRPNQKVNFKFWVRKAQYDMKEDVANFANRAFQVEISDAMGKKQFTKTITADEFGGISGSYDIPTDAALGNYHIFIKRYGGGYFRVEEYKKPEYEVVVEAPKEPIKLGDKIKAIISAKYYFGAPVTEAKVKYKVMRTTHNSVWHPFGRWDWLYGKGYWWFAPNYDWYPGWKHWGCIAPLPWWWHKPSVQPELVMENEVEIGKDGRVEVVIDTSVAKELFGDSDHKYVISAEVVDQSRRTIMGQGSIIAARKPFKVTVWLDRGYYRIGDTIVANSAARSVDGKAVEGKVELVLYKITYNKEMIPTEKEIEKWQLKCGVDGVAKEQFKAFKAGQYRLSSKVTDKKGNTIEGGFVFSIRGAVANWEARGDSFRFNDIELLNDKKEYTPGEKVKLMINTARVDSSVLLFLRPTNGTYLAPKFLQLKGKSLLKEIEVVKKDMPNFFIEALTVSNGKVYTATKEIVVPPEKRIINIDIEPSKDRYKPGEKAKIKLKLTDIDGKPIKSSAVITIYDKSLEYISGGSNIKEIKAFFWKWRRSHSVNTVSNTMMWFNNIVAKNSGSMYNLGIFGAMLSDEKKDSFGGRGMEVEKSSMMNPRKKMSKSKMMLGAESPQVMKEITKLEDSLDDAEGSSESESGGEEEVAITVRKNFADTAYWNGTVTPDENGIAEIELDMPENLTTWKILVWGMANGTKVGEGSAEVITSKDLIIRLQAPRFFVETDEVVLSAIVHNYHKDSKDVAVGIKLGGDVLELLDGSKESQKANVRSGGEVRINWRVKALKEGEATIQMLVRTDNDSDAMEMKYPVLVHGISKQVPYSGNITIDGKVANFAIEIPNERRVEETLLELRYSPTLAGAMVDALPYLVSYPYGCTEQTLNRFVPTVITRNILQQMGLNLEDIKKKRTNLNAQEVGDDLKRAAQWQKRAIVVGYDSDGDPIYSDNPVFDEKLVDDMISVGIKKLRSMQNSDGGWGWFSGWGEVSYPHTTGVVLHGFQQAKKSGVDIPIDMINSGLKWLKSYQKRQIIKLNNYEDSKSKNKKQYADNIDAFVFMVIFDLEQEFKIKSLTSDSTTMLNYLYRDRNNLSIYAKAMFGLSLHKMSKIVDKSMQKEIIKKRDMIIHNIEQYLVMDKENQTAYLNLQNGSYWWCWYGSEIEANAYYLKLLSATDPKGQKASWLVKYLINNRKHATYWNSTRDSALCVEALADYIVASGEGAPDLTIDILYDDKVMKTVKINKENLFSFDNKFIMRGEALASGKHNITIRKSGTGPLYFNSYLTYFTLEKFIKKAGLEIKVQRKYYKLDRVAKSIKVQGSHGQALDQKVEKFERKLIANLATLKSGDLVEIELIIESKNDYEYIMFADWKAAGFEACEVRSGYNGNSMGAYVEYRDQKVCFFIRTLARGKHSLSYRMKAEIPGKFSALPTQGSAMYAPELKANSDEIKLNIEDR